jgi:5-methyltetrahydrofolate--homocysteine methyltransferase
VAAEMEREGFALPLLIGGATTSRVHTAVKIHPNYRRGQTVYVTDASRAVGVVSQLMSQQVRGAYVSEVREEYAKIAAAHARGEENKRRLSLKDARKNALALDWANYVPPKPSFLGTRVFEDYSIAELIDYIDWSPFFSTWELTGNSPRSWMTRSSARPRVRSTRTRARCSTRSSKENWFRAAAVVGFWPANSSGDDIAVEADTPLCCTPCASSLRGAKAAPTWRSRTSSRRRSPAAQDYIGAFAVTAASART